MPGLQLGLIEAKTAEARMDALCGFIEYWLGLRQAAFGEPREAVKRVTLPMPLRRLYEFAGRWPDWRGENSLEYVVPALTHQDGLLALHQLRTKSDGKIVFLADNQDAYDCRTLPDGDDPPVWCVREGEEALVSDSLSRFLVSSVLQEITLGARLCFSNETLCQLFQSHGEKAIPVWCNDPHVDGDWVHNLQHLYLWDDVLVGLFWDCHHFAANSESGIAFLAKHQNPISRISLHIGVGMGWVLDIMNDGSATTTFRGDRAKAPAGTFDFEVERGRLANAVSEEGQYQHNPVVFFERKNQTTRGEHIHDWDLVKSMFEQALRHSSEVEGEIRRRFQEETIFDKKRV